MAMSANAVLMKFFKLPPAMRMILALAGFGSLASIIFLLLPSLRTRQGQIWVLIIGGIGLVLFLLIWGIRRLLFSKKSSQLAGALESQGPTRGDIAEQEKIYREKFRAKLADLKSNGLNVYRLPWFVLMGEPGCGKTASLIHSGLDFPLGKDEVPGFGGTRNYNWWFTNDAVILDTAGRIAFQEEGTTDKTEWEYFLKLLKANRPRCPVNGLVIALPADKLLRDNSEERAQKATILRERLRQVHQTLGVRFPTFVLVTKMDLVGGFSEFFEEIRVDLQQRNQMFGWSRPGEFQDPFDPAAFPQAFDEVYGRLRNWGMRYLQRKATEDELGMIVTFPESFRQLGNALNDYVATIFQKSPLLEPPFFRGFYFTSAVQEGAPIFDVFTKSKAGIAVHERPTRAVDSKAFFIHDFYADKVFPEHGLVFRSAKHVSLNKRMRHVVWYGSAAMILLMAFLFFFGNGGIRELITAPHDTCDTAVTAIEKGGAKYEELGANLTIAKALRQHIDRYNAPWTWVYARFLFVGANIRVPQNALESIHARFVLDCIFKPVMQEAERRFTAAPLTSTVPQDKRQKYMNALRIYTKWFGEVVGQHGLNELDAQQAAVRRAEFEALLTYLEVPIADSTEAAQQFETALTTLSHQSRSFAREILRDGLKYEKIQAKDVIESAVKKLTESWMPLTQLSSDSTDPKVKYWAEFASRVGDLRQRYGELLSLNTEFAKSDGYADAVKRFMLLTDGVDYLDNPNYTTPQPGSLHEAFLGLRNFLETTPPETADHRIIRFGELLNLFKQQWSPEFQAIADALKAGAPETGNEPQSLVYAAVTKGETDLETAFFQSLAQVRSKLGLPKETEPLTYYANQNLIVVEEANPPTLRTEPATLRLSPRALGNNAQVKTYLAALRALVGGATQEMKDLEDLQKWPALLQNLHSSEPPDAALSLWFNAVQKQSGAGASRDDLIRTSSGLGEFAFWMPVELYNLADGMWQARRTHSTDYLLTQMAEKASATLKAESLPGLARLIPGYDQASNMPFVRNRFNEARPTTPTAQEPAAQPEEPASDDGLGRLGRRRAEPETPAAPQDTLRRDTSSALLTNYHTIKFLNDGLRQFERVAAVLKDFPGGAKALQPLMKAADLYVDHYFSDWFDLYNDPTKLLDEQTLEFLEKCRDGNLGWPEYQAAIGGETGRNIGQTMGDRLQTLLREVVLFDANLESNPVDDKVYDRIAARQAELQRNGRSLPYLLKPIRDAGRNLPRRDATVDVVFTEQFKSAWSDYCKAVRTLGPLTDDNAPAGELPNVQKLSDEIVYKQAMPASFAPSAPLLDVAGYGQTLLVHHLDAKLTAMFAAHPNEYPLLPPANAPDDSPLLVGIRDRKTIDPQAFISLLRQATLFQDRYGGLYQQVREKDSPSMRTLDRCAAWVKFLYENADSLRNSENPRGLDVWVTIVKDNSGTVLNAGSVYSKLKVVLPLLNLSKTAAAPIELATRAGEGIKAGTVQEAIGSRQPDFRWDLFTPGGVTFDRMTASVSDRHPEAAQSSYPERIDGWNLPGNPWMLLMAMGARPENDLRDGYWQIPVRMETSVEPIGFAIGLKIGSSDRPFPGVIPPLSDPGSRPKMATAEKYLTRK